MDIPAFIRQDDAPLFPKILWNRPVSRIGAGRLLIPGGHTGEFSFPSMLYQSAEACGIGECTVAFPDALVKLLGGVPGASFYASSTSGSLGQEALGQLLHAAEDVDAVLLGASLSNHSQTTILIEKFIRETNRPLILIEDALQLLQGQAELLTGSDRHVLIITMPQVFKLAAQLGIPIKIKPNGGLINKLEIIRDLSAASACQYVIWGSETIVAVPGRELIVTPLNYRLGQLPAIIYATFATLWVQNPGDRRAGLATAAFVLKQVSEFMPTQGRPTITQALVLLRKALESADDSF